MTEQRQNIPAKRWTCKHWYSGQHANASEPCGYCALEAEIEALRSLILEAVRLAGHDDVWKVWREKCAALAARPGEKHV